VAEVEIRDESQSACVVTAELGEEREEFLIKIAQGGVVKEEGFIDLGKTFQDGSVRGKLLPHFDEYPDDEHAHPHGIRGVQNVGGLEGAVLGERVRAVRLAPMPA